MNNLFKPSFLISVLICFILISNSVFAVIIRDNEPVAEGTFVSIEFTAPDDPPSPITDLHFELPFDGSIGPSFGSPNIFSYDWDHVVFADTVYNSAGEQIEVTGASQGLIDRDEHGGILGAFDVFAFCLDFGSEIMPGETITLIIDALFDDAETIFENYEDLLASLSWSLADGTFVPGSGIKGNVFPAGDLDFLRGGLKDGKGGFELIKIDENDIVRRTFDVSSPATVHLFSIAFLITFLFGLKRKAL